MVGRVFLGRYETIRRLGEGGMGVVYLARQIDLGRQVVVKVMHDHIASDPKFRERFQRETLLMARFQHPYVVTLYDASLNDPEGPCIVMEYIKGITLDTMLMRNGRLSPTRIARILGQLCEALQAAHTEGIVHRDLKPANLMIVDPDTPYEKLKVMDFGLAKMIDQPARTLNKLVSDTNVEFAVGTPGYISPEQVRGDGMDHRSDLYSVGVIMYELITGRLPFVGTETMDVLLAHATEEPPKFSSIGLGAAIPPAVEQVVFKCLTKNPADRPQSAHELVEMYESALMEDQISGPSMMCRSKPPTHPDMPNSDAGTSNPASTPIPNSLAHLAKQDPMAVIHQMQAWMPETIAAYKLRGFVDDVGGQVVESVPGKILVRFGGKGSAYTAPGGAFSWFGLGKRASIDMELRLERNNPAQQSLLAITVIMRSPGTNVTTHPAWRERCNQIFCDLRAYLMGNDVGVSS
jgi:serine/threonine protein kinase